MTDTTITNTADATARVQAIRALAQSIAYGRVKIEAVEPPKGRDDYLADRAAFRTAYADIASEIREAKRERWQSTRETLRVRARALIAIRLRSKEHARRVSRERMEQAVPIPASAA